jgi:hypothetical protein
MILKYSKNERKKEKKLGHLIETSFSSYEFSLLFVRLALLFDKNEISLRKVTRLRGHTVIHLLLHARMKFDRINQSICLSDPFFSLSYFHISVRIFRLMCSIHTVKWCAIQKLYLYFNDIKERKMSYFSSLISYYKCLFSLFMRLIFEGFFSKTILFSSPLSLMSMASGFTWRIFFYVRYNISIDKRNQLGKNN